MRRRPGSIASTNARTETSARAINDDIDGTMWTTMQNVDLRVGTRPDARAFASTPADSGFALAVRVDPSVHNLIYYKGRDFVWVI